MENYQPVGLSRFFGGMSTDTELGSEAQFYYGRHIDFRKNPSSFRLLPKPTNSDGGVVVDLVQDMAQVGNGKRYAVGSNGFVYEVASGVWSSLFNLGEGGGSGIHYRADVDNVYITGQTKVARISRVSNAKTSQPNWFNEGVSSCSTCYKTSGVLSYTLSTAIDEGMAKRRDFTADIEPVSKIGVKVLTAGTGNWTLTLHDDANTSLGSVTINNASIVAGSINYFTFSDPIRIQRGNNGGGSALTYHFHLTSTVADGTIATSTSADMSVCDMELWASALVPTENDLHPMSSLANQTLIGNGRYVASYEPLQDSPTTADFSRHRLTLPPGFEVCGFAQKNLMAVIGAEKRSSSGEFQEGALFFWDGFSETYNDYWLVPEGSPEGLFSHKNVVYYSAGGALWRMRGSDEPLKIRTFRNTDSEYSAITDTTHVYPNMMAVRRGILMIGYPSVTSNQSLEHGVYSLGSITNEYPESFGYSYTTSNGNNLNNGSNNLRVGMVKSFGDTMYISWRDDSVSPQTYSVDIVNNSSAPNTEGTLETLVFDNEQPFKYKKAGNIIATFEDLPSDATVTLKWKIDGGSWEYSDSTDSGSYLVAPINKRFLKIEIGVDITATTETPEITGLFVMIDPLIKERMIG